MTFVVVMVVLGCAAVGLFLLLGVIVGGFLGIGGDRSFGSGLRTLACDSAPQLGGTSARLRRRDVVNNVVGDRWRGLECRVLTNTAATNRSDAR